MPLYAVQLKSPEHDQRRTVNVEAASERLAAAAAYRNELAYVEFSLAPGEPAEPAEPAADADADVLVQYLNARDTYAGALAAYEASGGRSTELAELEREHGVHSNGKAYGPTSRGRGHIAAHQQLEPYEVVAVDRIDPDPEQLVAAVLRLQANPAAWDRVLKGLRDGGVPIAAVTAALYGPTWLTQVDGSSIFIWSSATVKTTLHTAYTADFDTHHFFSDASATEVAATGNYSTGGNTLGTKSSEYDTGTDQVRLKAANTSWSSSTISATDAIVWIDTAGAATTDPLYGGIDFGGTVSTTNGTFQITWDATGIVVFDLT